MTKKISLSLICLLLLVLGSAKAQKKNKDKAPAKSEESTSKPPVAKKEEKKKGPKAFKELIDSTAVSQYGLFGVHNLEDKWYFEIADTLLGREMMAITRYTQTAAGGSIYGGELVNKQVIKWEKGPNNKLFLYSVSYIITSPDSTKPIFEAVRNSNADPIAAAFEIKAIKKDSSLPYQTYVIDVSSTFEGDEQIFSLSATSKQLLNITSLQKDRSYIASINTYPINTEVRSVKTFGVSPPRISLSPAPSVGSYLPASVNPGVVTMHFNTSILLLPEVPMRKRFFDARVGYFASEYSVFAEASQKAEKEVFAVRWRLEPKTAEDAKKQAQGQLIEPKKPIVYYVDPATPEKWKPFIKQGIDDWQVAFESAGWKNAIRGEYWPENDSTMSLEDARFSVVRYFASPVMNAYGPNVHDPRSGEILESHIGWYHNVMRLLRNWYLVQAAAVDPRARNMAFDDQLMGELIRFVSSHEVGHTIGLRHNMGASSATPVEKLRDKKWLAEHGHTSSIMDYARFNYVAQPEDSISNLFPGIGAYDKWAIKWGYTYLANTNNAEDDKMILNEWVKKAYENPALRFGTESSPYDPRYQTEDLGDNDMKASEYGIKNLKRILPNLAKWSSKEGESHEELDELYKAVADQYRRYMGHVSKYIGGVYDNPSTYDMPTVPFQVVPAALQQSAVTFLNEQLFATPKWLLDSDIYSKTKAETGLEELKRLQNITLAQLLDGERLARIMEFSATSTTHYSVDALLSDLEKGILTEILNVKPADIYRRNLHKIYIDKLVALLKPGIVNMRSIPVGATYGFSNRNVDLALTDLPSVVRGHLVQLANQLAIAEKVNDRLSKFHYQDLRKRITLALDPK